MRKLGDELFYVTTYDPKPFQILTYLESAECERREAREAEVAGYCGQESHEFSKAPEDSRSFILGEVQWSSIRKVKYAVAFCFGLGFAFLLHLSRLWIREGRIIIRETIPENAIVYAYHPEVYLLVGAPSFWKAKLPRMLGLGNHSFVSYLAGLSAVIWNMKILRFERGTAKRPLDQIIETLEQFPDYSFGLRTDSGGPYFKIRDSLLELALRTKRPLVALRQNASKSLRIHHHSFALPGAMVNLSTSEVIRYEDLKDLSRKDALKLIQDRIDQCGIF